MTECYTFKSWFFSVVELEMKNIHILFKASERDQAQQDGINIYSIGVNLRDKSELEMLATAPDNVMTVSRVQELDTTIDEIKQKIFACRYNL